MESLTKALFLDLDGTLLNDRKEITPGNRAAIQRALDAGHRIIVTTGRPLVSAIDQARRLELVKPGCYLIAYNGGILYDLGAGTIIFRAAIPLDVVCQVFAGANRRGIHIQTYDETSVLVEPGCYNETAARYCRLIQMNCVRIPDIRSLRREPEKLLAIDYQCQEPLYSFRDWVLSRFGDCLDSFFSCDQYVEIVPRGQNKGSALLQLAQLLHLAPEQTIAVGDAANDISMIRAAHLGIAMANGTEEVRAAADAVTRRDNNHDGIAEVIDRYLLRHGSEV